MAVKIIDRVPDPKIVKRCSCDNCAVRLEYVPKDVHSYTARDYGGGSDTYHYISCPNCSERVYVERY